MALARQKLRSRFYAACLIAAFVSAAAMFLALSAGLLFMGLGLWTSSCVLLTLWVVSAHAQQAGGFCRLSLGRYVVLVLGIWVGFAFSSAIAAVALVGSGRVASRSA